MKFTGKLSPTFRRGYLSKPNESIDSLCSRSAGSPKHGLVFSLETVGVKVSWDLQEGNFH